MIAAVFAAFLVAALFIGAASAASIGTNNVVYVYEYGVGTANTMYYQVVSGNLAPGVSTDSTGTFSADNIPEGLYSVDGVSTTNLFSLKYPAVTLKATLNGTTTSIAGKSLLKTQYIDFAVSGNNALPYKLVFYSAAGGSTSTFNNTAFTNSSVFVPAGTNLNVSVANEASGEWSVAAVLLTDNSVGKMADGTASKYTTTSKITFNVGTVYADSITVSKDSIIRGASILLTVNGQPKEVVVVNVTGSGFNNFVGQSNVGNITTGTDGYLTGFTITLNDFGTRTAQFDTNATSDDQTYTFTAQLSPDKKVKVTVKKGEVTAVAGQDSYYLGNDITLSGTNTESTNVYLYVKGSNKALTELESTAVLSDNTWKKTFNLPNEFDAGTYTFYATAQQLPGTSGINLTIDDDVTTYTSLSVALKQPFLTATAESSVVAAGDDIVVSGSAEAASTLKYYVFGTNLFKTGSITPEDDGTYSQKIKTTNFGAGQYFVVIQHPMYDGKFNIGPVAVDSAKDNFDIKMQENSTAGDYTTGSTLFNTLSRQSANAAEALCQALDTQNIDDIYVKLSFIVASPSITMNSVSDVTKGSALKVSGTTNLKAGTTVTVDVLSTAFTAIEKSSVNSASFITLTTKVVKGADGVNTWEVTFDTAGLNVDTYTIQAMTEDLTTSTTVKVLEAVVTPTATATSTATSTATATATATPTTTPGFGAFLALAGLGAVAVLVLRRN